MSSTDNVTRYFVAKCDHIKRLYTARDSSVWACADRQNSPQPRDILTEAFRQGPVKLVFSANNCHGWHGVATMVTAPGSLGDQTPEEDIDLTQGCSENGNQMASSKAETNDAKWHKFKISWETLFLVEHGEQCLSHSQTEKILLPDKNTLNKVRNMQEIPPSTGLWLCERIKQHYISLSEAKDKKTKAKLESLGKPFFVPDEDSDPEQVWLQLIDKVETNLGKVLLACAFGSQRYNLHTAQSDVDMFIVYAARTRRLLGFSPPEHTIKNRDTESCDYTVHEIHRFCELLLGGDPRCVECLFLDPSAVRQQSPLWQGLLDMRQDFLTKQCLEKYVRDATGGKGTKLLDKWVANGNALKQPMLPQVSKLFYIIIRLLQNAEQVAMGHLHVYRVEDSPERALLISVRQGQRDYVTLRSIVDELLSSIAKAKCLMSTNQDDTIAVKVEDWLIDLRYQDLH